jgi:hypothetical protein
MQVKRENKIMKKKSALISLLFLLTFLSINRSAFAQYKISQIIEDNKIRIPAPYKYDGFLMNEFTFELISKDVKLEFIAFKNQKYKLLFCASSFEEQVIIHIYDKSAPAVQIAEKTISANDITWTFDPPKASTYSIVYEIPPSNTEVDHKACMVMLIGFNEK